MVLFLLNSHFKCKYTFQAFDKAKGDYHTSAKELVSKAHEKAGVSNVSAVNEDYIARSINPMRATTRPAEPKDMNFMVSFPHTHIHLTVILSNNRKLVQT